MQKLSIGIIGFNEEDGIGKLLESLQEQTLLKKSACYFYFIIGQGYFAIHTADCRFMKYSNSTWKISIR
jgi:glycosyltransferase involved in cell wall biosynthesis